MKILQIIPTLGSGGAEHFVVELSNELVRLGHVCHILTLYDIESSNQLINMVDNNIYVSSLHKKLGFDVSCLLKVFQYIRINSYDVVHAHVGAIKYITLASSLLNKIKFVATIHSEASREAGKSIDKWARLYMFKCKRCLPVTISEESELSFERFYKLNAHLIYNGVSKYNGMPLRDLRDNPEQIVFIHPASCQRVKNQELLFKAFAKLANEIPNVKLIWLGSNDPFKDLYKTLLPLMSDKVSYLGVVDNVRDYLAAADAMCLSSKMEGMPLTIIEAFSVGCPALCTPVGGIVNMVMNSYNGLLSQDLSVESYYTMLKEFCSATIEKRNSMRSAALSSFKKFSIEQCAHKYLGIYNSNISSENGFEEK